MNRRTKSPVAAAGSSNSTSSVAASVETANVQKAQGDASISLSRVPTKTSVPMYQQPPQLAYGWWTPHPPPFGPYFWPCLPPGYSLVPAALADLPERTFSSVNSLKNFAKFSADNHETAEEVKSDVLQSIAPDAVSLSDSKQKSSKRASSFTEHSEAEPVLTATKKARIDADTTQPSTTTRTSRGRAAKH
jgi:hypothetical protein